MTVLSYEVPLMEYTEYKVYKKIVVIVPPILIFLGTFGNLFSLVILLQSSMRRVSSYVYLAVLAVADTLVLFTGLLRQWIGDITGTDIRRKYDWSCKTISALGYIFSDYSVWLIIAVTVERYLAVCHPLKAQRMCSPRRAVKISVGIFALLFLINTHFFWTVQIVYYEHKGELYAQCDGGANFEALVRTIWPWVDAFMYSFIPFITILIFNALIIRKVFLAKQERESLQSTPRRSASLLLRGSSMRPYAMGIRRVSHDSNRLTVMLLTISFTFLLTTLPMNISLIITSIWPPDPTDLQQIVRATLIRKVIELLMYCNHSINFYLYCATGKKFRENVLKTLCRGVRRSSMLSATEAFQMDNASSAANVPNTNGTLLRDVEVRCPTDGRFPSAKTT